MNGNMSLLRLRRGGAHGAPGYDYKESEVPLQVNETQTESSDRYFSSETSTASISTLFGLSSMSFACQVFAPGAPMRSRPAQDHVNAGLHCSYWPTDTRQHIWKRLLNCPPVEYFELDQSRGQDNKTRTTLRLQLSADHRFFDRLPIPKGSTLQFELENIPDKLELDSEGLTLQVQLPESDQNYTLESGIELPGGSSFTYSQKSYAIFPSRTMKAGEIFCTSQTPVEIALEGSEIRDIKNIKCDLAQPALALATPYFSKKIPFVSLRSPRGENIFEKNREFVVQGRSATEVTLQILFREPLVFQKLYKLNSDLMAGILKAPGSIPFEGGQMRLREGSYLEIFGPNFPRCEGIVERDVARTAIKAGDFVAFKEDSEDTRGMLLFWIANSPRMQGRYRLPAGTGILFENPRFQRVSLRPIMHFIYPPEGYPPPPSLQGPSKSLIEYDLALLEKAPSWLKSKVMPTRSPSPICNGPLSCP